MIAAWQDLGVACGAASDLVGFVVVFGAAALVEYAIARTLWGSK